MEYYKTMTDLGGNSILTLVQSIALSAQGFFSIFLLLFWLFGAATTYFAILKTTGKKRFFHALTAYSFISFILALLFASMNSSTAIILSGYWVGFYILMTLFSWYGLNQYK